ncbi:hypothetical protein ABFT23_18030 [Nocardioides sp. C4-1]|uniref:hypothetical protein n=1 Tax=Nocardioides sp. C4-1 TaxID=3151851 RepID=UPI003264E0EA
MESLPRRRPSVLARGFAVGLASGARSTLGLVPPSIGPASRWPQVVAAGLVATELAVDKLPVTPSRLAPPPFTARVVLGTVGAATLARREEAGWVLPAAAGAIGAAAGTLGGAALRHAGAERGVTWPAALLEDAVALALVRWACG